VSEPTTKAGRALLTLYDDEMREQYRTWVVTIEREAAEAVLDVERIETGLAEVMAAARGVAWPKRWREDEFRWLARQLAAALRAALLEETSLQSSAANEGKP
jgi:hypothetical protein